MSDTHHPSERPDRQAWLQAKAIASVLDEREVGVIQMIARIVQLQGKAFVDALVAETERIQAADGLWLPDRSRKRTKGGVFFFLARAQLTEFQQAYVFSRLGQAQYLDEPAFVWEERGALVEKVLAAPGTVHEAQLQVVGDPLTIALHDDLVIVTIAHDPRRYQPRPLGLPPLLEPATVVTVYVRMPDWQAIAKDLKRKGTQFEASGVGGYDPALPGVVLYAQRVRPRAPISSHKKDRIKA